MVAKSHGPRRRTREKFRRTKREKFTVNKYLKEFKIGEKVALDIDSSSGAIPCRRFQGITGEVIGKRGRAYIINIYDGNKLKKVIAKSEHLKAIK